MNINYGLFPPIDEATRGRKGRLARRQAITQRAMSDLSAWLGEQASEAA